MSPLMTGLAQALATGELEMVETDAGFTLRTPARRMGKR